LISSNECAICLFTTKEGAKGETRIKKIKINRREKMAEYDYRLTVYVQNVFQEAELEVTYQLYRYEPPQGPASKITAGEPKTDTIVPGEKMAFKLYKKFDYVLVNFKENTPTPGKYFIAGPVECLNVVEFDQGKWALRISKPPHDPEEDTVTIGEEPPG
jgi:hypothetical protein